MQGLSFMALGMAAGVLSGFFGVGGGILLIPALVYLFQMSQHQAQGTTLAVLTLPVVFLGAWRYYASGYVKLGMVPLICLGFFLGGWVGAAIADKVPDLLLRKCFGLLLLFFAFRMVLGR